MSHLGRILVVDDEPRWLEPLSHVLTTAGYDVRAVNGGEPALDSVADGFPDLILLDVRMPGMGGFEVLKRFKARADTRDIPILLISGFAEVDERIEGLKLGAVDSVTKPFHAGELLARVRMQVELSRLRADHECQTADLKSTNEKLESEVARHQQAEQELRKSESRLRFALQTMSAGAWELDLVDHTAHRTLLHDRIFGYETKLPDWTYEMFLDHVLTEDREEVDRCFRRATETHSDWGFECRIRRTDGVVRWIWAAGAHERNAEGKPVRIAGIVQDITERHMAEVALRENEANLAITLQSIGDAVIATDAEGRITRMNPVAERLTGWSLAEAAGRPMGEVFRIVNAYTRNPVENPVEEVIARGVTVGLANHTVLLARDGREFQIADSAAPIRDRSGDIVGVVLVFSDVTERYEGREALSRSEENYRMLFEGMLEGFALHEIICDDSGRPVDYRFLSINPAFEKMTGIRAADAIGKTVRELMPETEAVWIDRYGRVALTGEAIQFEEHSSALGRIFQVCAYQPQPGRFAVVFDDITERKDAARNLQLRESFLSAITENQPGLLWLKDADGRFLMVNKAFAAACGREGPEQVHGLTDTDLWPKGLADKYRGDDEQVMALGDSKIVEEEISIGGERIWYETFKTPVRDKEGRVIGTTGYSRDVTERKAAEARIARLTQFYAALSHCSQAIVHSSSKEELFPKICRDVVEFGGLRMAWIGLVDEASGTICPVASYGEGTDYLKGIKASTDAQDGRGRGPTGTSIRENRPVWCQDFQHDPTTAPWHESGARFGWRSAASLPLQRGGKSTGALVVYSDKLHMFDEESRELLQEMADDVSFALDSFDNEAESKMAEMALRESNRHLKEATACAEQLAVEAQAAARAKSEFLALMSHELRTPLNGVLGFAELLSGTRLDEEQQEFTRTILDCGTHLLELVNDILDFSSIEKGRMQIESAPLLVAALVESSCRPIRKVATDKGLEFSCVTTADVPEQITGDIRRIRQILINLLGNAIKFTRQGSVVLEIAPTSLDGRPALEFSVEDTGLGISAEVIGSLFEPFTQADSTVSRQFEGTGLGLAISLRLAEAMGGTLGVESTPGKGSRFTFRLPLGDGVPASSNNGSGTLSSGLDKKSGVTPVPFSESPVLVVEDDPSSRILAGKILEHLGCRAEFAVNGQDAAEVFAPEKYSAILMDMQMPVMDGLEATRRIRERESGVRVPIIALTANVMQGDRERCLAAGMDEVLTKPFKMTELSDILARFLQP